MVKEVLDYKKIGLKSGLEIHQQLNTSKLFCDCPSVLRQDNPDFIIKRKLHAVPGESGEVDVAASYEASFEREFTYQGYETTCLVELDEEPPHEINKEALNIGLHIALILNCKIIPITQIMRKTVVDGSNTSGFQRTVLIANEGYIETSNGKVAIDSVCLEEDSARIINKEKGIFRLDRLGIPLIEIATKPDIKTPEQAKEVALKIGEILRSCDVKRGLGTIRQDVNLSIDGGMRVELKGFQDIMNIEKAMKVEIKRQIELVKKEKSRPEVRKVLKNGESKFLRPLPGSERMYPETDLPLLKISRKLIDRSKKTLPKLREEAREELKKKGLNKELISLLLKQRKIDEFKELLSVCNNPNLIGKALLIFPKEISSRENISLDNVEKILNKDVFVHLFESMKKGKFSENQLKYVMKKIVKGKSHKEAVEVESLESQYLEEKILKILKDKPGLSRKAYMGLIMKEFRGKVEGKKAMEIIKKYVK
ncbi:MAG: Glu-tRNA(Gln) amidotransferase subunit GatE [Candidatus Pacearchaeota archaeon]